MTEPKRTTIDADMTIREILERRPKSAEILYDHGMHCLGCPTAVQETLRAAAEAHGLDLDSLLKEIQEKTSDESQTYERGVKTSEEDKGGE